MNAWSLLDFEYQSAAIVCVDTIKYYSIPSVPSRLEGVKTRPDDRVFVREDPLLASPATSSPSFTKCGPPLLPLNGDTAVHSTLN